VPMRDYERLEGEVSKETSSEVNAGPTYTQMDEARRAALKREMLEKIKALVGNDKLAAVRLINELEADLLANGGA